MSAVLPNRKTIQAAARRRRQPSQRRQPPSQLPTTQLQPHPEAHRLLPPISASERDALRADIANRGIATPLEITSDGIVLDGHQRLHAAHALALTHLPVAIVTPTDEVEHISLAALQRRHLTASWG